MKRKHKRLFISVINDIFGKNYPVDSHIDVLPSEGYLSGNETGKGSREIEEKVSNSCHAIMLIPFDADGQSSIIRIFWNDESTVPKQDKPERVLSFL